LVVVLIPVFDDWTAVELVLRGLDRVAEKYRPMLAVIVDDASTQEPDGAFCADPFRSLTTVVRVRLRRNLGHQRAIAVGLVYVYQNYPDAITVVMDGDGEDRPEDIPALLSKLDGEGGRKIVFAERARRTENLLFKLFYVFYKVLHRALTGIAVRVGNYSVIPYSCLSSLVVISEIWNHYAAAVFNARLPYECLPLARGRRLAGKSKMNVISLVTHGLSAISVYGDRVGVRLLAVSSVTIVLLLAALIILFVSRQNTAAATAYFIGFLVLLLTQVVGMSLAFVFLALRGRSGALFLPIRDCPYFIGEVTCLDSPGDVSG
jgi:glycosyltransferase involved in cell wall biosynthesis